MATIRRFEDIRGWQIARGLVKRIYIVSQTGQFRSDIGLRDQITRAAVSIMSNIAEGFNRKSTKEFIRFLEFSLTSANEVKSLLYVAGDLEYLKPEVVQTLQAEAESVKANNLALIKYLKSPANPNNKKPAESRNLNPETNNPAPNNPEPDNPEPDNIAT